MDFEKLIENAENLYECVGMVAMADGVTEVSATCFVCPYRYVRMTVEYFDDDLNEVTTAFDVEPNRRANWGNDEPMFIITDCE